MQFTIAASTLFAALAAASPASGLEERQTPAVFATFYRSTGCNHPVDIITPPSPLPLTQDTLPCHDITVPQTVKCTEFTNSTLTRRIRLYNQPGCPERGTNVNFVTFDPANPNNNKLNLPTVRSYRFLAPGESKV
ncbi:hypothetical protein BU23DRAFT_569858 [Bimuria novae-zelandiae CBS 107.79]|uniref:Hypersensitive response-inducing protein n=1 Tax=Bimuria novae-zelandiae CBS 107.79 TaxID=1447943 RepID=A0A6A5V3L6_9PLEO|nr:hypothetical protein BU23DRAFT_569858 [Bimuria novae-zelandiae CBS 107.79]